MRSATHNHDERGIAMITAILVMAVIVLLATASLTLSSHTLKGSSTDRSRALAVHASESGIDRFLLYLDQVPADDVDCDPLGVQSLPTSPVSQFTVTGVYRDANENPLSCPLSSTPASVAIRSVGTAGGQKRTMESLVRLLSTGGSFGNDAIFSDEAPTFSGNTKVLGNSDSPDKADVYSNGSIALSGNSVIWGTVRTRLSFTMSGSFEVKRDVYAKGLGESSGPASLQVNSAGKVWGSVYNSTGSVSMQGNGAEIKGDASACKTITGTVGGATHPSVCPNPPLPIAKSFPVYAYDASEWTDAGYTIHTFTGSGTTPCSSAQSFIEGISSGDQVVRIEATCEVKFLHSVSVNGSLAIITNGSFVMGGNSTFGGSTGPMRNFYLMAGMPGPTCTLTTTPAIQFDGGATIGTSLDSLIYSPCIIDLRGNSYTQKGQVIGRNVKFRGGSALTYWGIHVPGESDGPFKQDIAYIREVVN